MTSKQVFNLYWQFLAVLAVHRLMSNKKIKDPPESNSQNETISMTLLVSQQQVTSAFLPDKVTHKLILLENPIFPSGLDKQQAVLLTTEA